MMKRILILGSFIMAVCCSQTSAQVALEVKGQPFNGISHPDVEGHPFLQKEWASGTVLLDNNKTITATLKFNIATNTVLFQDKSGQGLELQNKFSGFTLNSVDKGLSNLSPVLFVNGYPAIATQTEATLYQLVGDGKVKLLKYYKKSVSEDKDYYSSEITSSYKFVTLYYILKNNRLKEVIPSKKTFAKLFEDHAAGFEAYVNANTIDFRSDADLQKLFAWYNALS